MVTGGSSPPKSLRRSQRYNTNLMRQSLSPQKIHDSLVYKNYKLNPGVDISKKKINYLSAPISSEIKSKSNCIVKCNTTSFVLVKYKLNDILFSHAFQTDYVYTLLAQKKGKTNHKMKLRLDTKYILKEKWKFRHIPQVHNQCFKHYFIITNKWPKN